MRPIRIAISGKMGAGKSTVAKVLSEWLDVPVMSFASEFKRLVEECGITKENNEELYRKLCQAIGGGMREIDEDIWVNAFQQRHLSGLFNDNSMIVDDMRYPNEFYMLWSDEGFFTVRLEIPEWVRAERRKLIDHESETALDHFVELGRFDLVVTDYTLTPEQIAEQIVQEAGYAASGVA